MATGAEPVSTTLSDTDKLNIGVEVVAGEMDDLSVRKPTKTLMPQKNPHAKVTLEPKGKPEPSTEESSVTPRGMELEVIHDPKWGLYQIGLLTPGQLPQELKGKWTDRKWAEDAIRRYLTNYWKGRS